MDERFKYHQRKSSRIAVIILITVLAGFFYYDLLSNKIIRWDIFISLSVAAVTKIGSMLYFKFVN